MTYKEISLKYNISLRKLYNRVHVLRIEGTYGKKGLNFNKTQVKQLIEYNPEAHFERLRKNNDVRKIAIIEFYIKFGGIRRVSSMLNIGRKAVSDAVKEYNETGYITVKSKLNELEPFEENGNYINE